MTAPGGLLDFFTLEAAEHLDRLDALASESGEPDADGLHRHARALRGAATMAKVPLVADLAGALERLARAVRDGGSPWGAGQRSAIVSAVDELRKLVRMLKTLTPADEARAKALATELAGYVPGMPTPVRASTAVAASAGFVATEAKALEVAIAMVRTRPEDPAAMGPLVDRVHRVRGVAALKEFPVIAEIVEGIERAIKPIERGAPLGGGALQLLEAAAEALRDASPALTAGEAPASGTTAMGRFAAALAAFEGQHESDDRIVPIAELFHADGGPHVVSTAAAPPTTLPERFRLEAVSLAEHLRRLVADARVAREPAARDRAGRELRRAMRALEQVAASFREDAVSAFMARRIDGATRLDPVALTAVDAAATALADPQASSETVAARLRDAALTPAEVPVVARRTPMGVPVQPRTTTPVAIVAPTPPVVPRQPTPPAAPRMPTPAPMPALMPAAAPAAASTPLQALLAQGLAGLGALETQPLVPPDDVADETIVPIERLVYRGRAALARAVELRETIRRRGEPTSDELAELFDLLDLVGTE